MARVGENKKTVSFSDSQLAAVTAYCSEREWSLSFFVRQAVAAYLAVAEAKKLREEGAV